MIVAALGLDRLDDDGGDGVMESLDEVLGFFEAALLLGGVFGGELVEGIFDVGEGSLRPVEGRDVEFVDRFTARGREGAEEAAMESGTEGENRHMWRARHLVVHGGGDFLSSGLDISTTTFLAPFPHEGSFVCKFIRFRAGRGSENLVETFRGNFENAIFEDLGVVVLRKVAQGRAIDDSAGHFGRCGHLEKLRVAVANWYGGDLGINIKKDISVKICDVVAEAVLIVDHHVYTPDVEYLDQFINCRFTLGTRD